jgi:hypothetical protein
LAALRCCHSVASQCLCREWKYASNCQCARVGICWPGRIIAKISHVTAKYVLESKMTLSCAATLPAQAPIQSHCDAGDRRRLHLHGSQPLLIHGKGFPRATIRVQPSRLPQPSSGIIQSKRRLKPIQPIVTHRQRANANQLMMLTSFIISRLKQSKTFHIFPISLLGLKFSFTKSSLFLLLSLFVTRFVLNSQFFRIRLVPTL